jgi:Zn-finger nucleic acid-binding protein
MSARVVDEVEFDRCGNCRGLWFDAFEHEVLRASPAAATVDEGPVSARTGGSKLCPRCAQRMIDMSLPVQFHIKVESCGVCHGVFFDAGEFADYREETFEESVRSVMAAMRK